jgi:acyl-CoA synthetase (AMP-forming)/AMP-acid ligase II
VELPEMDYVPTMPEVIRRAAEKFGDSEFVVTPESRMTYQQADRGSQRLALHLLAAGVGKGTRVGLIYPYGTDWVVAWLAVTRIGALCMPLSTSYVASELRKVLRHGDIQMLLFDDDATSAGVTNLLEDAFPTLSAMDSKVLYMHEAPHLRSIHITSGQPTRSWLGYFPLGFDGDEGSNLPGDDFLLEVESLVVPADPLLAIFTSGTTAEPKGVVHTHGNFFRHGWNFAPWWDMEQEDRVFSAMPFFWVGGVGVSLNIALAIGSTVLCIERFEPGAALDFMEKESATRLDIFPQAGMRLRQYIEAAGRDVTSIPVFAQQAAEPKSRHNSLGMTETCGPYTAGGPEFNRDLPEDLWGSFGLLVPHVEVKIVDANGISLSEDQEGEICVRGYSLMAGIYKRERHEVFDDDSWFHTGDRGLLRNGYLFFSSRVTEMIKTAGANVAPREVEIVLQAIPAVGLALVFGEPDATRGENVVALVGVKVGHSLTEEELQAHAEAELSSYKRPRRYRLIPVDDVPHLATGKPDRLKARALLVQVEESPKI